MTRDSQSQVTPTHEECLAAASLLWGEAGTYAVEAFARLNRDLFDNELPPVPIAIGLTAYGHCIGLTRPDADWLRRPRITLASLNFNASGRRAVDDVLVHEMTHALLLLRGVDAQHNGDPWCRIITALSPVLIGHEIVERAVRPRRVPNPAREMDVTAPKSKVVRRPDDGALTQRDLGRWPFSVRPEGYYRGDQCIPVPTY